MSIKERTCCLLILSLFLFATPAFGSASRFKTYLSLGWKARQQKQYEKAEKAYWRALKLNPKSVDALIGRLYTFIESGQYTKAYLSLDLLLEHYPNNIWVQKGAAIAYFKMKRYSFAAKRYRQILKIWGEDPEMRLGLGLSLYYSGKKYQARKECLKCQYAFSKDPRLSLCLSGSEKSWFVEPGVYISYLDYTNPQDKDSVVSYSAGIDIMDSTGMGMYLFGGCLSYPTEYFSEDYTESAIGLAFYKSEKHLFLWGAYQQITGMEDTFDGSVMSLHSNYTYKIFMPTLEMHAGFWDGFKTYQVSPGFGVFLTKNMKLSLIPMIQKSQGDKAVGITEMKTRYSYQLNLDTTLNSFFGKPIKPLNLSMYFYTGERWYTIDNKGIAVQNGDEEYEKGGGIKVSYRWTQHFSPYFSIKMDKGIRQFGLDHTFDVRGVTAGVSAKF